jgi:hypothetical protein
MDEKTVKRISAINDWGKYQEFLAEERDAKLEEWAPPNRAPDSPPRSPEAALLVHRLVRYVDDWPDEADKAAWQNYWLACCRSAKCDYLFTVLLGQSVDREDDLLKILAQNNVAFWKSVGRGPEKTYYVDAGLHFLLQRFAYFKAWKLWCQNRRFEWGFAILPLLLPRLAVAIVLGVIFFALSFLTWELPTRLLMTFCCWWYIPLVIFFLSFGYLLYDCRRRIELKSSIVSLLGRTLPILFLGLLESFVISYLAVHSFLTALQEVNNPVILVQTPVNFWVTCTAFTFGALFIGIFTYVFWGEKSIAEPL